jgi:uncharacterized protein
MREENLALIKRGYEAFGKGDFDTIREMMSGPDAVWRTPGYAPFNAEYKGFEGVIQYFTTLSKLSDGTFKSEPETFFADGDQVVCVTHSTGTRDRKMLDSHMIHLFRIRDGKVYEVTTFVAEPKRHEEFWA